MHLSVDLLVISVQCVQVNGSDRFLIESKNTLQTLTNRHTDRLQYRTRKSSTQTEVGRMVEKKDVTKSELPTP